MNQSTLQGFCSHLHKDDLVKPVTQMQPQTRANVRDGHGYRLRQIITMICRAVEQHQ